MSLDETGIVSYVFSDTPVTPLFRSPPSYPLRGGHLFYVISRVLLTALSRFFISSIPR